MWQYYLEVVSQPRGRLNVGSEAPSWRVFAQKMVVAVIVVAMLVASAQAFAPQALPGTAMISSHRRVLPAEPHSAEPRSRSAPVPACSASAPQRQATLAASVIGLASQPVFWWSLYTLKTTGYAPAHTASPSL